MEGISQDRRCLSRQGHTNVSVSWWATPATVRNGSGEAVTKTWKVDVIYQSNDKLHAWSPSIIHKLAGDEKLICLASWYYGGDQNRLQRYQGPNPWYYARIYINVTWPKEIRFADRMEIANQFMGESDHGDWTRWETCTQGPAECKEPVILGIAWQEAPKAGNIICLANHCTSVPLHTPGLVSTNEPTPPKWLFGISEEKSVGKSIIGFSNHLGQWL